MNKRIFKYPLMAGSNILRVRKTSQVVLVSEQNEEPYIWIADGDTDHEQTRTFQVVGTGYAIDYDKWSHVGSYQSADLNNMVWHVYEDVTA